MGLGPLKNGRFQPITPWQGSWAQQEEERRKLSKPVTTTWVSVKDTQWPVGVPVARKKP